MEITRGDVFLADLNPVVGTEQAGIRPVLIIQIDKANKVSPHNNNSVYDQNKGGNLTVSY